MSVTGRLVHYSAEPMAVVRSMPHGGVMGAYKTGGLWFSVEGPDDWVQWCKSKDFCLEQFVHATEIVLKSKAKVLRLRNASDIDAFTAEYVAEQEDLIPDWPSVRAKWQGLIIAPYCWGRRLSSFWYHGWDCASGVIWDADAIAKLRPIEPPDMATEGQDDRNA
jgi:hypothetical protein